MTASTLASRTRDAKDVFPGFQAIVRKINLVIFPGFQALDLAVGTVFELANNCTPEPVYALTISSETGGSIRSSFGAVVDSDPFDSGTFDTLLVCGAIGAVEPTPRLLAYVRSASKTARRIASICTGAFVLAQAGLLDGRRATTHWAFAREMQRRHPKVRVEADRIFIEDRRIWTSAGMTACVDLALAMVEADLGPTIAREVAKQLVVYHLRAGGQSQFSAMLELTPTSDRMQRTLAHAREHLAENLSVETLAGVAGLSPRQFTRAFRAETGQSPAKAVEVLRVEAARLLVEAGRLPVDTIARETGFDDPDRMRHAFLRAFSQAPQAIRRAARRAGTSRDRREPGSDPHPGNRSDMRRRANRRPAAE